MEQTTVDLTLRCFSCNAFAYHDSFEGVELYTGSYICCYCLGHLFEVHAREDVTLQ